jgi:hypothetical protein
MTIVVAVVVARREKCRARCERTVLPQPAS